MRRNRPQAFKAASATSGTPPPPAGTPTPRDRGWLRAATDAMSRHGRHAAGSRVLDVAAGAGDQTLSIARRVGAQRLCTGDRSVARDPGAGARQRHADAGFTHVETRVADGEDLRWAEATFDAAVCRLGLMFFPDPLHGLREIHRALRPGGGICTMVFSRPEKNPCLDDPDGYGVRARRPAAARPVRSRWPAQPGQAGPASTSCSARRVPSTSPPPRSQAPFQLPSVDHYLDFVRSSASPILQILGQLDAAAADAAWSEMRERLNAFTRHDGWAGPNEVLLTAGRRPEETT